MVGRLLIGVCTFFTVQAHSTGGGTWDRIGPWNIFDDKDIKGEAGTLAYATSPKETPNVIYAGGQNNGVSSGIIKSVDGGTHWARVSKGLWDTRILSVWVHPDDPSGNHVFAGTHTGIYESVDGAANWKRVDETKDWGGIIGFREAEINGDPYIMAISDNGLLTLPRAGGVWQKIPTPGGVPPNGFLSTFIDGGNTEILTCIGSWAGAPCTM